MAKFLTTSAIAYHIENIIREANRHLILVTPYLKLTKNLFERLKDASNKGVKVILIFGKEELKKEQKNWLQELRNIELYFSENLHAKIYLNEKELIIGSMNLYEYSEKNNREAGVLFERKVDHEIFNDTISEIKSIISSSKPAYVSFTERPINPIKVNENSDGYNELARYLRHYFPNQKLIVNRAGFGGERVEAKEFVFKFVNFSSVGYKSEFSLNLSDKIREEITEKLDFEDLSEHRVYINGEVISLYMSIYHRDNWELYSREKKFELIEKGIFIVFERLNAATLELQKVAEMGRETELLG